MKSYKMIIFIVISGVICLVIFFGVHCITNWYLDWFDCRSDCWEQLGNFGQMYGSIGALFSGLAMFAAFIVYYEQRKANKILNKKSVEDNFYQMLKFHNEAINNLKKGKSSGIGVFNNISKSISKELKKDNRIEVVKRELKKSRSFVGHYFRIIYYLLSYINDNFQGDDKIKFTKFVRAQINNETLIVIYFNCFSDYAKASNEKFNTVIREVNFFDGIIKDLWDDYQIIEKYANDLDERLSVQIKEHKEDKRSTNFR